MTVNEAENGADAEEQPDVSNDDVSTSIQDIIDAHPLLSVFGDTVRPRIIVAILTSNDPVNPDRIINRASISPGAFYNHIDDLLDSGIVEQTGSAGNSPLYDIVDDERHKALNVLASRTGTDEGSSDHDPEPPN